MTDERWQVAYAIYEAAAPLAEPERSQYVHAAAPDEEIAGKVLAMLEEMEATADSGAFPEPAHSEDRAASAPPMALSPSAKIGSYQVLERLGSGGMGEVYLAYDLRLDRRVAIKLLPTHLTADAVARERLRREALAAAALDHPFICKIFEIGEDQGTLFIVMEYIRGETLYARLRAGPLPRSDALRIAGEVAEALEAAHAKPLVHRDLKPANVMLTSQGRAKVMDFGLAKRPVSDELKHIGTTGGDVPLTAAGAVAGTPEYMSPEQMTGAPLDHRSDLFSFGIILCELLTGKHPFQRNSKLETMMAILRDPPDLAVTGNAGLSPGQMVLIRRLLAKSPAERYQSMREVRDDLARLASSSAVAPEPKEASTPSIPLIGRDLRYQSASEIRADLKRLKRDTDSGRRAGVSPGVPGASRPRQETEHGQDALATTGDTPAPRRWLLWLPGSLAVIAAGLAAAWLLLRRPPQPLGELTQKRLTFNSSQNPVVSNAISPDGKYLAYSDPAGIHVKLISTSEERLVQRPAGVPADAEWHVESWFPDGTQLLADTYEPGGVHGRMWTVSVLGQSPRELHEGLAFAGGVSPDGTRIAFTPQAGTSGDVREIWVMGTQGDNPQKVLAVGENEVFNGVRWSPDGQRLAYIRVQRTSEGYQASIETCSVKGENRTAIVSNSRQLLVDFCWLPDGRVVYSRAEEEFVRYGSDHDNLWQVRVNGHAGTPIDKPRRITQWAGSNIDWLSASADGKRMTLEKGTYQVQTYLGELAAGGARMSPPRRLTNDEAYDAPTAWTLDSKAVLFESQRNGTWGIFKQQISQDTVEPVVTGPQDALGPRLSADGAWILYEERPKAAAGPSAPGRLMRIPVSGGVPEFVLETRNVTEYSCAAAPASLCVVSEASQDNKRFILTSFDPLKGRGKVLRTIQKDPTADFGGKVSPDGTTFALSRGGDAEIHIRLLSLSGGPDREFTVRGWPSLTGLDWSPDGKGLYCGSLSPQRRTLLYVDLNGNARMLWQYKGTGGGSIWGVASPDGRYVAILGQATDSNVWMLEGF